MVELPTSGVFCLAMGQGTAASCFREEWRRQSGLDVSAATTTTAAAPAASAVLYGLWWLQLGLLLLMVLACKWSIKEEEHTICFLFHLLNGRSLPYKCVLHWFFTWLHLLFRCRLQCIPFKFNYRVSIKIIIIRKVLISKIKILFIIYFQILIYRYFYNLWKITILKRIFFNLNNL